MHIYHYDPNTGDYIGSSEAQPSPAEPGAFLVPAHATCKEPPENTDSQKMIIFRDGDWIVQDIPDIPGDETPSPAPGPDPTPEELRASALAALDAEYQPQFRELQLAWAAASMAGDTVLAEDVVAANAALKAEYQAKLEAIDHG